MIDYPAMIIPIHSTVDPILDPIDKDYKPANPKDKEVWSDCKFTFPFFPFPKIHHHRSPKMKCGRQILNSFLTPATTDSPEKFAGAPVTVQLVCRRFREEECIGLAGVIESSLKTV